MFGEKVLGGLVVKLAVRRPSIFKQTLRAVPEGLRPIEWLRWESGNEDLTLVSGHFTCRQRLALPSALGRWRSPYLTDASVSLINAIRATKG